MAHWITSGPIILMGEKMSVLKNVNDTSNVITPIQRHFIMIVLPLIENHFGKMIHEIHELKEPLERWQNKDIANVHFMRVLSDWLDKQEY